MPLLYDRSDDGARVEIRVTGWWYATRYATLPLLLALIVFGRVLGPRGIMLFGTVAFACIGIRVLGFWRANRELAAAMRRGELEVTGSAWDYRHPLHYAYRRQLPTATVVKE